MVSVCLPSDALSQYLPSYLGFSYLGRGVSLHCCYSKAQPLLLTLGEGYLFTAAPPDLKCGVAPLRPSCAYAAAAPGLRGGVAPLGHAFVWSVAATALLHGPSQTPAALSNSMKQPFNVGPPKTDGSWWRGLTVCGPLEKGMAAHFSILALRTS